MRDPESKTIGGSMEETKERHVRFLRAMNSPVRRTMLRALKGGPATVEELRVRTNIDEKALAWHLSILEYGYCVEKETREGSVFYALTQEGQVVDYIDK
jgi:DNA-binding transcriptional ArsR family regulator